MMEQTRHGDRLVQAAAGFGRYTPSRGDLGLTAFNAGLNPAFVPHQSGPSNTMMYVAVGVGVLALAGAAYYYAKS